MNPFIHSFILRPDSIRSSSSSMSNWWNEMKWRKKRKSRQHWSAQKQRSDCSPRSCPVPSCVGQVSSVYFSFYYYYSSSSGGGGAGGTGKKKKRCWRWHTDTFFCSFLSFFRRRKKKLIPTDFWRENNKKKKRVRISPVFFFFLLRPFIIQSEKKWRIYKRLTLASGSAAKCEATSGERTGQV